MRIAEITARLPSLLQHPVCQELRQVVGHRTCHLVGGALRDTALGHELRDIDVIVAGAGAGTADLLADRVGSRSIRLGGQRFASFRVMRQGLPIDIWDRGAMSLEADLRRRDFTIHSIALDLHNGVLSDPFSGIEDLAQSQLRMTTSQSFAEDPLRILRLCRFAAELAGFRIDSTTLTRARESVKGLASVAKERIRMELERTLDLPEVAAAAELWTAMEIVPEAMMSYSLDADHRRRVQLALPKALRTLEQIAATLPVACDLLSARIALLLILLERAGGQESTVGLDHLQQRGFLARARSRQVSLLLESTALPTETSQLRWFLHRMGELWPGAISLATALADPEFNVQKESQSLGRALELATLKSEGIFDPPALVSGDDLKSHLGIQPGAPLGRLLDLIRRRQIEGTIATRAEALELVERLHSTNGRG